MEKNQIINLINKEFEKIKNNENVSNALDFIDEIKEYLEKTYVKR